MLRKKNKKVAPLDKATMLHWAENDTDNPPKPNTQAEREDTRTNNCMMDVQTIEENEAEYNNNLTPLPPHIWVEWMRKGEVSKRTECQIAEDNQYWLDSHRQEWHISNRGMDLVSQTRNTEATNNKYIVV